jgi:branched-chain amino acid transport system permease protein
MSELLLYHIGAFGCVLLLVQSLFLLWRVKLFSLGHYGMACIGAYGAAFFLKVTGFVRFGESAPLSLRLGVFCLDAVFAVGVTGIFALAIFACIRFLREDYFAVVTLLFAEALHLVASNIQYLGGSTGFEMQPLLFIGQAEGVERLGVFAFVVVLINLVICVLYLRMNRSLAGAYIAALHDDERALEMRGVHTAWIRGVVFVTGSVIAGLSGVLFLHFTSLIVPSDFTFAASIQVLVFVVLGSGKLTRCILMSAVAYAAIALINIQMSSLLGEPLANILFKWKESLIGIVLLISLYLSARKGGGYESVR